MAQAQRTKAEWAKVRDAYLAGEGSIADLAKRFGIRPKTVEDRSQSEKWGKLRAQAQEKAREKAVEKAASTLGEAKAARLKIAVRVMERLDKALDQIDLWDPEGLDRIASAANKALPADFLSDLGDAPEGSEEVEITVRRTRTGSS